MRKPYNREELSQTLSRWNRGCGQLYGYRTRLPG